MTKFEEFEQVIARLRAPDGCPWDRAQTHASLKRTLHRGSRGSHLRDQYP